LENWAERNLINFNNGRYQVLSLGSSNPMQLYILGADQLENSSALKKPGALEHSDLTVSQ